MAISHEEYIKSDEKGPIRFPFRVKYTADGVQLTKSVLEDCRHLEGSRVSAINGQSVEELVIAMTAMISGESIEFRRSVLSNQFPKLYYVLTGGSDSYSLDMEKEGKTETVVVPAASREQTKSTPGSNGDNDTEPYTYEIFKDDGYALLNFTRCENLAKFNTFIKEMFIKLDSLQVKNLIVDVRKNGGGNSSIADEFCFYLTDKSIRQFAGMNMKISKQISKYYSALHRKAAKFPLNRIPLSFLWKPLRRPAGKIFTFSLPLTKPPKRTPIYNGKVFILASHYTFSSASAFAAMIKANGPGKIVGEPTGGYTSCYGDAFSFSLPHTYFQCGVSHKFFIGPEGSTVPVPVQPDYPVVSGDPNAEADRVMEEAVRLTGL